MIHAFLARFLAQSKNLGAKRMLFFLCIALLTFGIDQGLKQLFLNGFSMESNVITLGGRALVFNDGVAFSMFKSLGESLKYLQILLLIVLFCFTFFSGLLAQNLVAFGLVFGAGAGNIIDRFIHSGVVDYIYWHYGFEFAIFNFADVMIDIGVGLVLLALLLERKKPCDNKQC
ncbi:signal peptidase II [Helicobacter himalayensis]|uniref:signal peptidase II n=1 Tax=Helicobacter himalayensis TaxID=1591088 RepID=UPI003D6EB884